MWGLTCQPTEVWARDALALGVFVESAGVCAVCLDVGVAFLCVTRTVGCLTFFPFFFCGFFAVCFRLRLHGLHYPNQTNLPSLLPVTFFSYVALAIISNPFRCFPHHLYLCMYPIDVLFGVHNLLR
ncbi:hypothetical protein DFP72DRAFT_436130 [Ephemerocybe angulata]|uniref:Uncharacterized protein n=1 Tax=Ephemerocybe angulata TaxID=980116 RepID=A0A8H6HTU5_9AGAR|nr:hypothetical protein DFP72DRAFT_436130 [Tulosesus angulatus]